MYGQSDRLIQIQTPVDEPTTSGKQIKSVSEWLHRGGQEVDTGQTGKWMDDILGNMLIFLNSGESWMRKQTLLSC